MRLDAVAREFQRLDGRRVDDPVGGFDVGLGDRDADLVEVGAIESQRHSRSAPRRLGAHVGDDLAHRRLDIRRILALGGQQRLETLFEIGVGLAQA